MREYQIPLADPLDAGLPPQAPSRLNLLATPVSRWASRIRRRRRLAYVDSHFPWARSGFRYEEALEIYRRRPDTLFFAVQPCTDDFPARVHRLADFGSVAPAAGVTDVHVVFLNLALAVVGVPSSQDRPPVPGERNDLSLRTPLARWGMRTHVTVYPGGGYLPGTSERVVQELGARVTTIFTSVPEVKTSWPGAVDTRVPVSTTFYRPGRAQDDDRLRLAFVGDDKPRKGLADLLAALRGVDGDWTLDVVGPHARHAEALAHFGKRVAVHGWLDPSSLQPVLQRCNVVIAPATRDLQEDGYGDVGMVDGFPTTASLIAMLSGCCLVGCNPNSLASPLRDGDWIPVPERDSSALSGALRALAADPGRRRRTAERGRATVVAAYDVTTVVGDKLRRMALVA